MKRTYLFGLFALLLSAAGCASFQAAGEVQRGRPQLIYGDPKVALAHFQRASDIDSNFVMRFRAFDEGVWTYVGRANYATGQLSEARQALDRALSMDRDDSLARVYLGLVLAEGEDRSGGLREIGSGMKGIYDQLEHITYYTSYGKFWDPRREIRSEIENSLKMISGKDVDWPKLTASAEWVGTKLEAEVELARRDEFNDLTTQMGGGSQP